MQVNLKDVRVTYTIREVVGVIVVLVSLVGHIVRTEMQNSALQSQVATLTTDVAKCKAELSIGKQQATR